jgi:hypothetical protein
MTISTQQAIETLERFQNPEPWEPKITDRAYEALQMAISALEKQEQSCDTCRHGRFGDRQCDNCGVRYPNHYEAEEES